LFFSFESLIFLDETISNFKPTAMKNASRFNGATPQGAWP